MSRRKLCVVCLERPRETGRVACKPCFAVYHRTPGDKVTQVMASRARAFERRRWKAKAETMPVKVVRRNTCLGCSVTVPGRLPKGWYRVKNSGRPFTLCANCKGTAR